ncbi:MAG: hypothetical protein IH933_14715 [Euryarchaeota archaeon]|jgi:metal-dependent amidase/aminoacylase/carboxypeptidase family protein|nr:hypothetical protein [Euryarchaeota archaeon]
MDKRTVFDAIDADRERFEEVARQIWETPELGLFEEESAQVLIDLLSAPGRIERAMAEFEETREGVYETPLPAEVAPPFDVTAP